MLSALVINPSGTYITYPTQTGSSEILEIPRLLPREEISDPIWKKVLGRATIQRTGLES